MLSKERIEELKYLCIKKISENVDKTNTFIASPSNNDPNYVYHWTRDAALVMEAVVDYYKKTNNLKCFQIIVKYVNCEYELQQLRTIAGLGEPKYNVDRTAFNDPWGRPQNDGPALRGTVLLKILPLLKDNYKSMADKLVISMIKNDADYVLEHVEKHSFDLWEESNGYHFYTRVVQCKFLKMLFLYFYEHPCSYFDDDELLCIKLRFETLKELISHHYDNYSVISSFGFNGKEARRYDASILLALCHINFDTDIIDRNVYYLFDNNLLDLLGYFSEKYKNSENNMIGRYIGDSYFDGHAWTLCTLGMTQYLLHRRHKYNNFENDENIAHSEDKKNILNNILNPEKIIKNILAIDDNLDLSEQYDPERKMQISAKKLTWNYSELYFSLTSIEELSVSLGQSEFTESPTEVA